MFFLIVFTLFLKSVFAGVALLSDSIALTSDLSVEMSVDPCDVSEAISNFFEAINTNNQATIALTTDTPLTAEVTGGDTWFQNLRLSIKEVLDVVPDTRATFGGPYEYFVRIHFVVLDEVDPIWISKLETIADFHLTLKSTTCLVTEFGGITPAAAPPANMDDKVEVDDTASGITPSLDTGPCVQTVLNDFLL